MEAPVSTPETPEETVAFSNAVRLTIGEWVGVGLFALALILLAPRWWAKAEPLPIEPDERLPHDLSNDYWLFERYAHEACERYDTVMLGDSVIWGEYVTGKATLSHYLNEQAGRASYANLGLDGAAPLALEGLIKYYASAVTNKNVLLQCNLLWMSSPTADYQDSRANIAHPGLVPQGYSTRVESPLCHFESKIPAITEDASGRIGVEVARRVPFTSWTTHLQQAYYERTSIPSWTLDHPYDDPFSPLHKDLPWADGSPRHLPLPWFKTGMGKQDYPWVNLDTSWQWQAFQRVIRLLEARNNRVFVVVGPFNEHIMEPASLERYQALKAGVETWLRTERKPHVILPPLPSDQYGDASHPLANGYANMARQLVQAPGMLP